MTQRKADLRTSHIDCELLSEEKRCASNYERITSLEHLVEQRMANSENEAPDRRLPRPGRSGPLAGVPPSPRFSKISGISGLAGDPGVKILIPEILEAKY
jgi:hypothetical protein